MSENNIATEINGIFTDVIREDPRVAEEFVTVHRATLVQEMVPGHWLTPERALAGLAFQRGEIDVAEYARRTGETVDEVRERFLKCGLTEDGKVPDRP